MGVLAFDIGATKTGWGCVDLTGKLSEHGSFPTAEQQEPFVDNLLQVIKKHTSAAIGIGMAGTISADHEDLVVCPNVPTLSHLQLVRLLREGGAPLTILENDARCALIGEVWKGSAQEFSSAVLLTLGTGVGGAVMQKGTVLPHPQSISLEIGRLIVDPTDIFPTTSGFGTVEALIGGRNLQERFGISLADEAQRAGKGEAQSLEIWGYIAEYFHLCLESVYAEYRCKTIIIAGKGVRNLSLYLGDKPPPCPVIAAVLGEQAGIFGAARLALDIYEEDKKEWYER